MLLNVLVIFFTSALICGAAPTLEKEHCGRPSQIEGATLQGVWNAESYSPGSVATFTCVHGYVRDGPIKMACIEGSWLDISKGQCKILGHCSKPPQSHENGELEGQWNDDTFPPGKVATYICPQGYSQTSPMKLACIEGEWIPVFKGQCIAETVCNQETVKNGIARFLKETYIEGETVELVCNEGYKIEHKPEEPRKCTSNGWSPPLQCISKTCDRPVILNGYIHSRWYSFPMSTGRSFDSVCNSGFLTSSKESFDRITCTKNGWDHEPKCFKQCNPPSQNTINAIISYTNPNVYIEGDKLHFQCFNNYKFDGKQSGEMTCRPDGRFSGEKCHKKVPCNSSPPRIDNGKISRETLRNEYYTGSTVEYICNDGYHIVGSNESQCLDGNWLPPPTCVENSCGKPPEVKDGKPKDDRKEYKHAESAVYKCSPGYTLSGSESAVCLFGKWERVPTCIYSSCEQPPNIENGAIKGPKKTTYLPGERVTYECFPGFTMGQNANVITCENSVWADPPRCKRIGQACSAPPVVQNGDTTDLKRLSYPSGSSVKYKCANYYKLEGKDTITCRHGEWEKEPICRVPCTTGDRDMQQNNIQLRWKGDKKLYGEHGDIMEFACLPGYEITGDKNLRAQCLDGVINYPKCRKVGE